MALLFLMAVGTAVLCAPFAFYYWTPIDPELLSYFLAIGIGGFCAHLCLILAFKLAPLTIVAPMEFLTLLTGTLYSAYFFGEGMDMWTIVGAGFIVISSLLATFSAQLRLVVGKLFLRSEKGRNKFDNHPN